MVAITLRADLARGLTNEEIDANMTNLKAAAEAAALTASWTSVTGKPATLAGYGITDAQAALVSGTSIKTVNGQSVLGSGNIQIDGGLTSFNTRTGAVTLGSGDVTTALGFSPVNKAGDSITGDLLNSAAYSAPNNDAGPGTPLKIRGSTGTGAAGAAGGHGHVEILGGGATSAWASFAGSSTRGGVLVQGGSAQADSGNTYAAGSSLEFRAGAGTTNGTQVGFGGTVSIRAGQTTRTDGWVSSGGALLLYGARATQSGYFGLGGGGISFENFATSQSGGVSSYPGTTTEGGELNLSSGNYSTGAAQSFTNNTGGTIKLTGATATTGGDILLFPGTVYEGISGGANGTVKINNHIVLNAGNYSNYAQPLLVSGSSIKTVNGVSVLGSGNIQIDAADGTKLPLAGGALTGKLIAGSSDGDSIEVRNDSTATASSGYITFKNKNGTGTYRPAARISGVNVDNAFDGDFLIETYAGGIAYKGLRVDENSNVLFYDTAGNAKFEWDSSNVRALINSNVVLHAGNYSSYALPLSGGTLTGELVVSTLGTNTQPAVDTARFHGYGILGRRTAPVYITNGGGGGVQIGVGATHATDPAMNFTASQNTSLKPLYENLDRVLHSGNYNTYAPTKTGGGASGTWGINVTGASSTTSLVSIDNSITWGQSGLQFVQVSGQGGTNPALTQAPDNNWWHIIRANHGNSAGYYTDLALPFTSDGGVQYRRISNGGNNGWYLLLDSHNYSSYAAPATHYHDRLYNGASGSSSYLALSSGNELEFFDSTGALSPLYLQYSAAADSLRGPGGNVVLHAGNYSSYAAPAFHTHSYLPLSGGTITGSAWSNTAGGDFVISNSGTVGASATLRPTNSTSFSAGWSVYAGASGAAIGDGSIGFWNHTAQAARFYVTQAGAGYFAGNLALHAGNYSSYALPLNSSFTTSAAATIPFTFRKTSNATHTGATLLVQNDYGTHSWGVTAEFRVDAATGDRPSVLFTSGAVGTSWSLGFVSGSDDTFRIVKNHGHRAYNGGWTGNNNGWGTEYLTVNTSGVVNAPVTLQQGGNQVLHAGNYSSYALPVGGKSADTYLFDGYGSNRFMRLSADSQMETGVHGGNLNGTTMQYLLAREQVQNHLAFRAPSSYETWNGSSWVSQTVPTQIFRNKPSSNWDGLTVANGTAKVRFTWLSFGYKFWSSLSTAGSTNGNSFKVRFYTSADNVTWIERWSSGFVGDWPGYHVWPMYGGDSAYPHMRIELEFSWNNVNNCTFGDIALQGAYGGYTPLFDWDYNRNITLGGDLQLNDKVLRFDQSGTRSWNARATDGNLDIASGDLAGLLRYNSNTILHAGNYSSYALPLSGGTLSGTLYAPKVVINPGNDLSWGGNYSQGKPTISATSSEINFYPSGSIGGLTLILSDSATNSNVALQQAGNQVLHAGNYNYFALPLSGGTLSGGLTIGGDVTATGNVTAYSDESLKKDWAPVATDFVARLAEIKHGTYTRIDSGERQAGASAQDWQKLLPEVVNAGAEGILSLAYGNAAVVSAIELAKRVVEQEERIKRLEALVEKLIGD